MSLTRYVVCAMLDGDNCPVGEKLEPTWLNETGSWTRDEGLARRFDSLNQAIDASFDAAEVMLADWYPVRDSRGTCCVAAPHFWIQEAP